MFSKLVFISLFCGCFNYGEAQVGMGPLNIKLIRISECPADEQIIKGEIVSRDDGFDGMALDANLPYVFDDTISYNIRLDKIQHGQVQKGVFKRSGDNACVNMVKYLGQTYVKAAAEMGAPSSCPVPAGSYHVDNFKFDPADTGLKTFLYGHFLMYLELLKDNKKITCSLLEFTNSRPGESI